ncbi:MAG: hypothetical protein AB7F99_08360 [Vicinamibacterales bacterium]
MDALVAAAVDAPDWVLSEMPPGYQNRVAEIRRLSAELEDMSRFGRLLWAIGPSLRESVVDLFAALRFNAEPLPSVESTVAAKLDHRRLLMLVSSADRTIDKQGPEVAQTFALLHQTAGEHDRVVLITNGDRMQAPVSRAPQIAPDALKLLQRMGVNILPAPTLFKLWTVAGHNVDQAKRLVSRLHEQDGGLFEIQS